MDAELVICIDADTAIWRNGLALANRSSTTIRWLERPTWKRMGIENVLAIIAAARLQTLNC
ncbi:hypothetical protein B0A50_05462 [Salinomyces thailandicus]|uniref:Uncharacterized protein n=1 Tax=Salinomyces thailandicus TaxID=706561 RepID=A0A4U0TTK1_9PEZI|nr:hypothetical protein B0A50_05462 [Salinomyces thailandica]